MTELQTKDSTSPETSPLLCLVTGMEHSGTTFLSKLISAHPRVNAGFECGILLAENPAGIPDVQPWANWLTAPVSDGHWGLGPEQLANVSEAPDWNEAYRRLIEHCTLFLPGEDLIVDKTPRYLQQLPRFMEKVPGTPCLVLEKDQLLMYHSYKRRGFPLKNFCDYWNLCQAALSEAESRFRVLRVSQERLSSEQDTVFRELCDFLGLEYQEKYTTRGWCKRNMHGISFIWLFKRPYDIQRAMEKAREEVTEEEIAELRERTGVQN